MGLYEKIYNVMNDSAGLEKNLTVGSGANSYKAVGEKEVLNMLKPLFKKYKLIVFPVNGDISEQNNYYDTTFNGETTTKARNVTQLKVQFKIVDVETGESEMLVGFGNGADSQDKGSGKAFTYAFKTALSKTFMLFSGEDTDNEHSDDITQKGTTTKSTPKQPSKPKQTKADTRQPSEAGRVVLEFGKYNGKTIDEIAAVNLGYIEWLADNARDNDIKQAAQNYLKPDEDIPTDWGQAQAIDDGELPF